MKMHIAVIPARKESKGVPFKNRALFDNTADFIDKAWFDKVVVSTDDEVLIKKARERGYSVHLRSKELCGDAVSIKKVFEAVVRDLKLPPEAVLWLFYLPIVSKNFLDLLRAKQIMDDNKAQSLCGFIPAKTHPFNCWLYNEPTRKLRQYIKNDVYRRQDLPPAWSHHHYICCFRAIEIANLNSELINKKTYPFFLDREIAERLIEVDTPEELEKWEKTKEQRI